MSYLYQGIRAQFIDWIASIWAKVRTRNTGEK